MLPAEDWGQTMDNASDSARRFSVRLHLATGVGSVTFRRLLDHFGEAERVFAASRSALRDVPGVGPKTAEAIFAVDADAVAAEFAAAETHDVRIITFAEADYPVALKNIPDPPPVLYVRGRLEPADAVAMAVVGSRRCSHYGTEQAGRFGGLFARAGLTVVSGGARGIDTAAHRGALAAEGRTIAVMGCGLAHIYPTENRDLFEQIVDTDRGAVVSALPMDTGVQAQNFPTRNRIISGLAQGVLVVEAARRSGSLVTARHADEQGRPIFALPGRVDSPYSQGANELIRDGAVLVQNLDDVLEQLGGLGETLAAEPTSQPAPPPMPPLDDTERRIVDAFDHEPLTIDQLAAAAGLPAHQVVAAMTTLTLKGLIAQQPGNVYALKRRPE